MPDMKKFFAFSLLLTVAAMLNVGCSASASVHKADATKLNTATQVAYVTSPSK